MSGRVLVVGSYPPIPVPGAAASVAEVQRAWAAGYEVTVAAPRLSAAHYALPVAGLVAGRRLANLRRVTRSTRLVLVVEDGFPLSHRSPVLQVATAALLARAMRSFDHVRVVRAGQPNLQPPAWTRLAAVADETVDVAAPPAPPGVTAVGPPEEPPGQLARRIGRVAAQRVLGRRAPAVAGFVRRVRARI